MVGLAKGVFEKAAKYSWERKQFGQPVGDFQAMQVQLAEAATKIEAASLMTYNAARMKEEGQPFVKHAAMAKWYASRVANEVSQKAIEWCGGVGYTRETGSESIGLQRAAIAAAARSFAVVGCGGKSDFLVV